jgi:hypothetical protein
MAEYLDMKPIIEQHTPNFRLWHENNILKAVVDAGISVDKERLLRALNDARYFYREGFDAAMSAADVVEVVRCKDCKYGEKDEGENVLSYFCQYDGCDWNYGNHFCSYGERRNNAAD